MKPNHKRMAAGIAAAGIVIAAAFVLRPAPDRTPAEHQLIPAFASAEFGWLADTEFLPPDSGPGPVTFDKAHPYVRNNTVGQPTFRISDLSNPILQPWVVERMKRDNDEVLAGKFAFTARSSCMPAGVPGFLVFGCGARTVYVLQTRDKVVMISDGDAQVRHIYLNAAHTANPKPSWYGESVGYYEGGNTLVIDTIGLNDKTFVDNYRTPHSEQLHVVERWTLSRDEKSIDVSVTVDDPGAFTTTWSAKQHYERADQGPITEMICAENNTNYFGHDVVETPMADQAEF